MSKIEEIDIDWWFEIKWKKFWNNDISNNDNDTFIYRFIFIFIWYLLYYVFYVDCILL